MTIDKTAGPAVRSIMRYHEKGSHVCPGVLATGGGHEGLMPDKFLRFPNTRMVDLSVDGGGGWLDSFLRDACGLSAFKNLEGQHVRWCLRSNPSAGALQPNEVYIIADRSTVLGWHGGPSLFHYHPFWHSLEVLCEISAPLWKHLVAQLPSGPSVTSLLVAVTALYWRSAWKYGDVAFHAVQRDTGHTLAALGFSALATGNTRCALVDEGIFCIFFSSAIN